MKSNLRIILYAIAAGLIFMLWQKWQMAQNPAHSENPQIETVQAQSNQDVPSSQSNAKEVSRQLITITTDLMTIQIDRKGGNIIHATLNDYKQSIDNPQAFALLHESNPARMIFQSGFQAGQDTGLMHNGIWQSGQSDYQLNNQEELRVPLTWKNEQGVIYTKTFVFKKGEYQFSIEQGVNNQSDQPWTGLAYDQIIFGEAPASAGLGHVATFTGAVVSTPQDTYQKVSLSDIASVPKGYINLNTQSGWVAMMQHYFIGALVPERGVTSNFYTEYNAEEKNHAVRILTENKTVQANQQVTFEPITAYFGPKIAKNLEAVAPFLDKTIDYGYLFLISQFMFKVMDFIHQFVGNWGWSIVIMTLLIKLIFFMPSAWAYKSMAKMRGLQPEMLRIREQYAGDRAQMSQEVMKLYRKEKVNPASGCLPMLLQIPFFIAFYWVLAESVQLRQAPWFGWIQDLSAMDPYYILPIINAALMFLQQKLNPPPPDPMQAKIMMMLPLVFGFMFMWFPSGLVLYWTVSNAFSIVQQYIMNKRYGAPLKAHNHKKHS